MFLRILLLSIFLVGHPSPSQAKSFYKWYDAEGNLHITDKEPPKGAKNVDISKYKPGDSSPSFQKMKTPSPSSPSPSTEEGGGEHKINPSVLRLEKDRLEKLIRKHERLRSRSSNPDQHQRKVDKYRRELQSLNYDPYQYFIRHGFIFPK